jgi:hypothetical protein
VDTSRRFAGFIGPVLIALAASETVTSHIWAGVPPTQVYLAGTLWLVAGISIVRGHNRWEVRWPVVVTLVGWFAILGGLFRMFAPEFANQHVPNSDTVLAVQAALIVAGIFLTFKAYSRASGSRSRDE